MANKFSQSIMERLEQEARLQKNTPAQTNERACITEPLPQGGELLPDLSVYIKDDDRRRAKGKTFYLDEDLILAIERAASEKGVSESRIVNSVMRSVLGLEVHQH